MSAPPKAGTSPHSSAHEQESGAPWVSRFISATIGPIAQSLPSASLQAELLSTNSGPEFL